MASKDIPLEKIWTIIQSSDKIWVLASVIMGYAAIVARGLRWSNLLEPMGYFPKKWNNIHAVALSYFVSLVIPRSGEIVRCTAINQVENIPVDKLFGTVILERVIDTSILLLFIGMAFLLNYDIFTSLFEVTARDADSSSSGLTLIWTVFLGIITAAVVGFLLRKKIMSSVLWSKAKKFVEGMKEGFLSIQKMKKRGQFILFSIVIWAMYYFSMMAMLKALQMDYYSWNESLFLVVAGGLGVIIPTQNGIGTYHLLIKYGVLVLASAYAFYPNLSELEIQEIGLSLAWLQWGAQTIMMIVAGIVASIAFALQRKKNNAST